MKIIIAGAGAVGFHLAELLAKENQDITLIDTDEEVLSHAGANLDVMTVRGDAASIEVLEQAEASKAKLFIAVTTSEKTNLLLAILAKQCGAKKTIARVNNPEYLQKIQKDNFFRLGIDVLISPHRLAVEEIQRLLKRASFTDLMEFENGKLSVVGFTIDTSSSVVNQSISDIVQKNNDFTFRAIALLRDGETLIPKTDTFLHKGDHLYMSTCKKDVDRLMQFAGKFLNPIKNIMIIGGTPLALQTAEALEKDYSITIVTEKKELARSCVQKLKNSLVIQTDPGNIDTLKEEGLERMDAFIALAPNSEINIISSLMAERLGVYKTIALVDNVNYTHISQNIGIDTIINKKLIAANDIFRHVRKGKVQAIASLHGVDAEMIEFEVHKSNRLLRHPIKDLGLPTEECIVAGVIRGKESFIPGGDFMLELNDKVILLVLPQAISQVEEIFK